MSKFSKHVIELTGKAADKAKQSGKRGQERKETDPVYSWVQHSLDQATLTKDDLKEYRHRKNQQHFALKFARGERHQSWKGLYHWNTVCQMPEDLRNRLLFDGEIPVARLDISSSYASMLPWHFEDDTEHAFKKRKIIVKEKDERNQECKRLQAFLSNGDFYLNLLPDHQRNSAKDAFNRFLNNQDPDPIAKKSGREFHKRFPKCFQMVSRWRKPKNLLKKYGINEEEKSPLSHELHGRQREIIKSTILKCRANSIYCIPVSDELIVPLIHHLKVRFWMQEEIFNRTGVCAKVGGQRYVRKSTMPETGISSIPIEFRPWRINRSTGILFLHEVKYA